MILNAEIKNITSKKDGRVYECLELDLGMNVKTLVFLKPAELAVLKLNND